MTHKDWVFDRVSDFAGRTVLVTGAANGVGVAIATMFAERDASLAALGKSTRIVEAAKRFGWPRVRMGGESPTTSASPHDRTGHEGLWAY
jgi:NAD(P)-dependent dehydrogenase (short-subunit alcohol dehydrogenase family)